MCGLQKGGRHWRGRRVVICLLGWGGEGRLGGLCASDVGGGQDKRAQAQGPNGHCGVKKALGLQPRSPIWGSEAVMGLQEHQKGRREKGPPGTRRNSQTYPGGNGYFFRKTHIHTHTHTPRPGISSVSHTHTQPDPRVAPRCPRARSAWSPVLQPPLTLGARADFRYCSTHGGHRGGRGRWVLSPQPAPVTAPRGLGNWLRRT